MNRATSPAPRPTHFLPAVATALASGLLLAACGGGGGGDGGSTTGTPANISRADASADAGNGVLAGSASAQMLDTAYDTTLALSGSIAGATPTAARPRPRPLDGTTSTTDVNLACAGGGTATITITGGTTTSEHNSTFDAGEVYDVTFAACVGRVGLERLDGTVRIAIGTVSSTATSATVTATDLAMSGGLTTWNGAATIFRQTTASGGGTTETSSVAANNLAAASAYNGRSGSFTVVTLSGTRTTTWNASSVLTGWTWSGSGAVSGTVRGRSFSTSTRTTTDLSYGADGVPVAGAWTVTRSDGTITATLTAGSVAFTLDDGSNGSVDDSWTETLADLDAAIG